MSTTTTPAGVPMDSLYCEDNSHDIVPAEAQPFVRANCPLAKMSKEEKGSDGVYHGRICHRPAVKQHRINQYHATAKQEWEEGEKSKAKQLQDEKAKAEERTKTENQKVKQQVDGEDVSGNDDFEFIGKADLVGAPTNVNAPGRQTGGAKKSLAGKVWDAITRK